MSNLYAAIAGGFREILSVGVSSATGVDSEESIGSAIGEVVSASGILINQVVDLAQTPKQLEGILTSPSDPRTLQAVDTYVASQLAATTKYTDNNFNKSNTQSV